jgi:hypothetical protein
MAELAPTLVPPWKSRQAEDAPDSRAASQSAGTATSPRNPILSASGGFTMGAARQVPVASVLRVLQPRDAPRAAACLHLCPSLAQPDDRHDSQRRCPRPPSAVPLPQQHHGAQSSIVSAAFVCSTHIPLPWLSTDPSRAIHLPFPPYPRPGLCI